MTGINNDSDGLAASDSSSDLSELREKHRALKAKIEEQQKKDQETANILNESQQRPIELEIRPKFIVPDTNCFIDHINLIDRILTTNYFIVVVPLLVVSELDKLSKSIATWMDDSLEHAEYVQRRAKSALQYLNDKFEARQRNIKAMTSQGSVLETIQFRTEEIHKPVLIQYYLIIYIKFTHLKKKGTNDELILGCCLHYCRDNARDFMPNSKSNFINPFFFSPYSNLIKFQTKRRTHSSIS